MNKIQVSHWVWPPGERLVGGVLIQQHPGCLCSGTELEVRGVE